MELIGTPKQIAWAQEIRDLAFAKRAKFEERLMEVALGMSPQAFTARQILFDLDSICADWDKQASAKWWIDNRESVERLESTLAAMRHRIDDEIAVVVPVEISGVSAADQMEIAKLQLAAKREELQRQREAERKVKELEAKAKAEEEAEKQVALWRSKDEVAAKVRAALESRVGEVELAIWWSGDKKEKRIYVNWGRASACYFVTGNQRSRPDSLKNEGKIPCDEGQLLEALRFASAKWKQVTIKISVDGKAV